MKSIQFLRKNSLSVLSLTKMIPVIHYKNYTTQIPNIQTSGFQELSLKNTHTMTTTSSFSTSSVQQANDRKKEENTPNDLKELKQDSQQNANQSNGNNNSSGNDYIKWFGGGITFLFGSGVLKTIYDIIEKENEKNAIADKQEQEHFKNLLKELEGLVGKCSTSNITQSEKQQNSRYISSAEKAVKEILDNGKALYELKHNHEFLVNFLYLVNCVSNYNMQHQHEGLEARNLLESGQAIVEKALKYGKHIPDDKNLDNLNHKAVLAALNSIKDLAEVYTTTTYFLGRSYSAYGASVPDKLAGKKYFELSNYLGKKCGLFEAILSDRGGLCLIAEQMINDALMQGNCADAEKILLNIITRYKNMKSDDSEYIVGYKPGIQGVTTITLVSDHYHQLECGEQMLKYYGRLIAISDPQKKLDYVKELNNLIETSDHTSLFTLLNSVSPQKAASFLNNLGELLIILEDTGVGSKKLQQKISSELSVFLNTRMPSDKWEFIYEIFDSAIQKTSNNNFTKIDGYKGLMMACKRAEGTLSKSDSKCNLKALQDYIDSIKLERYEKPYNDPSELSCMKKITLCDVQDVILNGEVQEISHE